MDEQQREFMRLTGMNTYMRHQYAETRAQVVAHQQGVAVNGQAVLAAHHLQRENRTRQARIDYLEAENQRLRDVATRDSLRIAQLEGQVSRARQELVRPMNLDPKSDRAYSNFKNKLDRTIFGIGDRIRAAEALRARAPQRIEDLRTAMDAQGLDEVRRVYEFNGRREWTVLEMLMHPTTRDEEALVAVETIIKLGAPVLDYGALRAALDRTFQAARLHPTCHMELYNAVLALGMAMQRITVCIEIWMQKMTESAVSNQDAIMSRFAHLPRYYQQIETIITESHQNYAAWLNLETQVRQHLKYIFARRMAVYYSEVADRARRIQAALDRA